MVKKVVQQGRSHFGARSVLPVREHDKMARTPLAGLFNIPILNILEGLEGRYSIQLSYVPIKSAWKM
jgi:hypothetical protein